MTDAAAPTKLDHFDTSIAAAVEACLRSFDRLHQELARAEDDSSIEISISDVDDEAGRFRVWAGNIGAHRTGLRSLDYRLRDASHIKSRVQSLLQDLSEILDDATSIISGEKTPWDKMTPASDSDPSDDESSSEDPVDDTELRQLRISVRKRVTLLFRVSMAVRNPAAHDRFLRSANIDTSHYEKFDVAHVQSKFPNAHEALVESLGKAISKRRLYFKYRESHAKKLSCGIAIQDKLVQDQDLNTEAQPQSTIASSLAQNVKDNNVLDLEEDNHSVSGLTQTSFATSVGESKNKGLVIPPLPKQAADGNSFECPFCFMIISVGTRRTWKKHVYKDLLPYVCTFPECTASNRVFERRHEWFQHERQTHRQLWHCIEGCAESFSTHSEFEEHVRKRHKNIASPEQLTALSKTCGMTAALESRSNCNLCGLQDLSLLQLERHLGKHQQQLALFALPSITGEADDEDGGDGDSATPASFSALSENGSSPSLASPTENEYETDTGLPAGWEEHTTPDGRPYYTNHIARTTTWRHPNSMPSARLHSFNNSVTGRRLPDGWDVNVTDDGLPFYVDNNAKTTTWNDPRSSFSAKQLVPDMPGWEVNQTLDGRLYYINHNDNTATWNDPRSQPPGMAEPVKDQIKADQAPSTPSAKLPAETILADAEDQIAATWPDSAANLPGSEKQTEKSLAAAAHLALDRGDELPAIAFKQELRLEALKRERSFTEESSPPASVPAKKPAYEEEDDHVLHDYEWNPPNRGAVDQEPLMIEVEDEMARFSRERRFVLVPGSGGYPERRLDLRKSAREPADRPQAPPLQTDLHDAPVQSGRAPSPYSSKPSDATKGRFLTESLLSLDHAARSGSSGSKPDAAQSKAKPTAAKDDGGRRKGKGRAQQSPDRTAQDMDEETMQILREMGVPDNLDFDSIEAPDRVGLLERIHGAARRREREREHRFSGAGESGRTQRLADLRAAAAADGGAADNETAVTDWLQDSEVPGMAAGALDEDTEEGAM